MNFETKYIDELIEIRQEARLEQNWKLSDKIRDYLDTKHIFVFDTKDRQVVYHRKNGTRQDFINQLKIEQRAQKLFDAWLHSLNSSIQVQAYKKD
ncbi:MAG: hypothetical protein P8X62_06155 [Flavobacteriaceae bacterium]